MKKFYKYICLAVFCVVLSCCKSTSANVTEKISENIIATNLTNCAIPQANIGVAGDLALISVRNGDNPFMFTDIVAKSPDFERLNGSTGTLTGKKTRLDFEENNILLTNGQNNNISVSFDNFKIIVTIKNTKYLYGFGERFGGLNLMGDDLAIEIKTNHQYSNRAIMPIPVVYDSNGSFVYFGSPYIARALIHTEGDTVTITYSNGGNNKDMQGIDLYVGYNKDLQEASSNYLKLVGLPPLPPKWAFGYIQSKYGYFTSTQVLNIAKKFKELDIPITGIVLDLYWFKYMGDIDWNLDQWEDPKDLTTQLGNQGIKLITISEPFFDKNSKNYKSFESKGFLGKDKEGKKAAYIDNWWGKGGVFDYSNPKANAVLWDKCYEHQLQTGVGAFWTDLGEPEGVYAKTVFAQGTEDTLHNIYNLLWSKNLYLNWTKKHPNDRPFILSRSSWSGSPKYGISTWSGDVKTDWSGMELQPFMMQSATLAGFSFCGHDVGGFVGEGWAALYEKWQEFGLFTPVHRAHGSDADREPWAFDEKALPQVKSVLRKRAQFIPYIYSTAYQTCSEGIGFVRPVDVSGVSSSEEQKYIVSHEYYFGPSIIFAPTFESEQTKVYLPKTTDSSAKWVDLSNYSTYAQGKSYTIDHIAGMPSYFLKPGGIFVENADAHYDKWNELTVYVNATGAGEDTFVIYNDDGITRDYTKGECNKLQIHASCDKPNSVSISVNPLVTGYSDELPKITFCVIGDNVAQAETFGTTIEYPKEPQTFVIQ